MNLWLHLFDRGVRCAKIAEHQQFACAMLSRRSRDDHSIRKFDNPTLTGAEYLGPISARM